MMRSSTSVTEPALAFGGTASLSLQAGMRRSVSGVVAVVFAGLAAVVFAVYVLVDDDRPPLRELWSADVTYGSDVVKVSWDGLSDDDYQVVVSVSGPSMVDRPVCEFETAGSGVGTCHVAGKDGLYLVVVEMIDLDDQTVAGTRSVVAWMKAGDFGPAATHAT